MLCWIWRYCIIADDRLFSFSPRNWIIDEITTFEKNGILSYLSITKCVTTLFNIGVCPRLEFDNIMLINCLGYELYIYGAFEFLCNSIANL